MIKNKIASFVALTCCMVGSMALAAKPKQVVSQFDVLVVYPKDFERGKTEAQIQALKNRIRRQIMTANYINHQPGGVPATTTKCLMWCQWRVIKSILMPSRIETALMLDRS